MESIMTIPFMEEIIESCHYFWEAGWGEFHAGNVSYLLSDEEISAASEWFEREPVHVEVGFEASELEGSCFLVTRAGGAFRTIRNHASRDLGIIRIGNQGYDILWGLDGGKARATSELPAHILCHQARRRKNADNKIVMHCHPTYVNAMTAIHELDEKEFTKSLWKMNSECILVFPEGLGLLPWMVCGDGPIGPATAEKMEKYRVVIWPIHGMFASGASLEETIGLIETIEKNAHIYLMCQGCLKNCIHDNQLKALAEAFHITAV